MTMRPAPAAVLCMAGALGMRTGSTACRSASKHVGVRQTPPCVMLHSLWSALATLWCHAGRTMLRLIHASCSTMEAALATPTTSLLWRSAPICAYRSQSLCVSFPLLTQAHAGACVMEGCEQTLVAHVIGSDAVPILLLFEHNGNALTDARTCVMLMIAQGCDSEVVL